MNLFFNVHCMKHWVLHYMYVFAWYVSFCHVKHSTCIAWINIHETTWHETKFMKQHGMKLTAWQQKQMHCMTCNSWYEAPSAEDTIWTLFYSHSSASWSASWPTFGASGCQMADSGTIPGCSFGTWPAGASSTTMPSWNGSGCTSLPSVALVVLPAQLAIDDANHITAIKKTQTNKWHHRIVAVLNPYSPWQLQVAHLPPTQVTQQITKSKSTP